MTDAVTDETQRVFQQAADTELRALSVQETSGRMMNAAIAVDSHLIVGLVENSGLRLLDVLMGQMSNCLTVFDANVHSPHRAEMTGTLRELVIPKSKIELIAIPGELHEAPRSRANKLQRKHKHSVLLTIGRFAVTGMLHLEGTRRAETFLSDQLAEFVAVEDATVNNLFGDGRDMPVQTAILRAIDIGMLHFTTKSESAAAATADQLSSLLQELGF